jgi:hypothetical protein
VSRLPVRSERSFRPMQYGSKDHCAYETVLDMKDSGIKVWKLRISLRQAAERRGADGPPMAPVKALRPDEEAPSWRVR